MKNLFLALFAIFALFSCSKDNENENKDIPAINVQLVSEQEVNAVSSINDFLGSVTSSNDLSQEEIDAISSSLDVIEEDASRSSMAKIVIKYPSVDAQGNPITLSGCIYYNKRAESFSEILLYTHQTAFSNNDVPSGNAATNLEPNVLTVSRSTIVFASDYVGFNASGDKVHPYMNQSLAARNEIDMLKAGMVFMMQDKNRPQIKSVKDGLKTYVVGYSQGGAVALATHRAIEADAELCSDINFCGSYCGAGPYDLETTFEMFKTQDEMSLPAVLPYVLVGMYESYPENFSGINLNDYLSDEAVKNDMLSFVKSKSAMENALSWYTDRGLTSVTSIMSKEALDENSTLWKTLTKCMRDQSLIDGSWTPKHNTVLYHSTGDDIVSYENSKKAYDLWKGTNKCKLVTPTASSGHIASYVTYILAISNGGYRVDK